MSEPSLRSTATPRLRQAIREWRCGRRNGHGPNGFYEPEAIQVAELGIVWLQECQACGRFTVWRERRGV